MIHRKIPESKKAEALATGVTVLGLAAANFLTFYCDGREEELVCINNVNNVEEPQYQTQPDTGRLFVYQNPYVVRSAVTVSGNASVSPFVS